MLNVAGLEAGYGQSRVLFGISFEAKAGEVVSLIGRNGMGKTTTVRAIMGLLKPKGGSLSFEGRDIAGKPPNVIARLGLGLVPEEIGRAHV